jgi:hypothetical protein
VVKRKVTKRGKARARPQRAAKPVKPVKRAKRTSKPGRRAARAPSSKWVRLVAKQGVMLASAHGPVRNVAHTVAGEPIIGGWWAHPKAKAIFAALSELDNSADIHCFRLFEGKVTFVHRRLWPALVRLGRAGVLVADQLAVVKQEHLPSGDHRTMLVPFPEWVDSATADATATLDLEAAHAALPFFKID